MSSVIRRTSYAIDLSAMVAAVSIVGCAGNVVATSDATATTTVAFVSIDRAVSPTPAASNTDQDATAAGPQPAAPTQTTNLNAAAIFLRVPTGADERLAARLMGADLVLPPPDRCEPVETLHDDGMPLSSLGPIDLVDVGEVAIESDGERTSLSPKAFPSVADLVAGLLYTSVDGVHTRLPDRGLLRLRVTGSASFGPAELSATSPGAVKGLSIDHRPLTENPVALPRADISLDWEGSSDDRIYADLTSTEDGPVERIRCSFRDVGHGTLPVGVLPQGRILRLGVHRFHQEPVAGPGLEGGAFRIDEAVTVNLQLEVNQP